MAVVNPSVAEVSTTAAVHPRLMMEVSSELVELLDKLAERSHTSRIEILRKAIALLDVSIQANDNGQKIGILDEKDKLIQDRLKDPNYAGFTLISQDQAFERIGTAAKANLDQVKENLTKARAESGHFFTLTLVFAGLGFLVVMVAVCLLLAGNITAGVVSTIAGLIPEVTAALFFAKDRELRGIIDKYHQHLIEHQRILTMIDVAETVTGGPQRDELKKAIITKVLGIT